MNNFTKEQIVEIRKQVAANRFEDVPVEVNALIKLMCEDILNYMKKTLDKTKSN